jgi:hypothetical protein
MLDKKYVYAFERDKFFSRTELDEINLLEKREQPVIGRPGEACKTNLFFGFFFDGTKNNYRKVEDEQTKNYSNVARLYDCYPGAGVPGVLPSSRDWKDENLRYTHFFKVYIPGVATPFPEVKDSGKDAEERFGAAFGRYGQRRIVWALVQAINNIHRYFLKAPLVKDEELNHLLNFVELNKEARRFMSYSSSTPPLGVRTGDRVARGEFERILRRLHTIVSPHWPNKQTGKCEKSDPGIVKSIYVSVFGFSRGATEARVFTNWLRSLCQLDAKILGNQEDSLTLGGFHVQFDFLGLFDTVASIGSANTTGMILDGHGAWADAEESLRVPAGIQCLHLVAAHELRRSFPVDSISVGGNVLPYGCEEIVVPGVHSDIGGGYCPKEQGKGIDPEGGDMLSRIPLLVMYKGARLKGVPLKLEVADEIAKSKFVLSTEALDSFNAYIRYCKVTTGPIHQIMREQARLQMMWRIVRTVSGRSPLQDTPSFLRATTFEKNDLFSAADEFEVEIEAFRSWLEERGRFFKPRTQPPGFKNGHEDEWEEIATWWGKWDVPSKEVLHFFDEYVHDSRAWFKLRGEDNEEDMHKKLKEWVRRRKDVELREITRKKWAGRGVPPQLSDGLTAEERKAAEEYAKTGKIPRMLTTGREPFDWCRAGYLRYRRVYGGWDSVCLS